jgi:hypothetical protein
MSPGRAMAQASHASNAFIHHYGNQIAVKKWQRETKQGFGTAIVLAASLPEIMAIVNDDNTLPNYFSDCVVDPEYGIKTTNEILELIDGTNIQPAKTITNDDGSVVIFVSCVTCAYVFGTKEELDPILGHLKLHP